VNIPVQLYPATQSKDLSFTSLHRECLTPLKRPYFCPKHGVQVSQEDIVKGYEYGKGKYVVITEEDLAEIPTVKGKSIDVVGFVRAEDVDAMLQESSYYLGPAEGSEKPFALLRRALEATGRAVLGKVPLWRKMHPALIGVRGQHLVLALMFYPDEVRDPPIPAGTDKVQLSDAELNLAVNLVEAMAVPFDLSGFKDEYRDELLRLVEAKLAGKAMVEASEAPKRETPADLMAALKASLEAVKKG
jgi:DNA end-binding protein Ku